MPHVLDIIHDALQCLMVEFIFILFSYNCLFKKKFFSFGFWGENSTSNVLHLANMMKLNFSPPVI